MTKNHSQRQIVVIAHNLRSTHNVGSLLRTAEGLGIKCVYLTGYTPYPMQNSDIRLPHMSAKIDKQIEKTSLGAAKTQAWSFQENVKTAISDLRRNGYTIVALEQHEQSIELQEFSPPDKVALVLGREVEGLEPEIIAKCDTIVQIPMYGKKESFNVVQASAMAMYHFRFV